MPRLGKRKLRYAKSIMNIPENYTGADGLVRWIDSMGDLPRYLGEVKAVNKRMEIYRDWEKNGDPDVVPPELLDWPDQ